MWLIELGEYYVLSDAICRDRLVTGCSGRNGKNSKFASRHKIIYNSDNGEMASVLEKLLKRV